MSQDFFLLNESKFLQDRLRKSQKITVLALHKDFTISDYNAGFSLLLRCDEQLRGEKLETFLLAESQHLLTDKIAQQPMPLRLNFIPADGTFVSLDCHLKETDSGYLIFAEHSLGADSDILKKMTTLNNEMAAMTRTLNKKNRALQEAKEQIKTLSGIVPICSYCKEIRDDKGYWNRLEQFIEEHTEAQFSHGICDKCMEEQLSQYKKKGPSGNS